GLRDLGPCGMFPQGRHPVSPGGPGAPGKLSVLEICERIEEEFRLLQAQNHSLKLECEKLLSDRTEMQRRYVMYYEMSYGLNIEMHKQVSGTGRRLHFSHCAGQRWGQE
uniref:Groucho/TLE N-terminal Q-rich domain-containing protein n=1 Tax=Coturnix japonica TaxID=93934 RepID=A0A8C2TEK6_COTJA